MIDLKNIGQFMAQAKKMQEQLKENQEALAKKTVIGTSGGGMVTIEATCRYQFIKVTLDPAFSNEEIPIQEDLIKAALNDATRKIEALLQSSMSDITSQLALPDDFLKDREE